METDNDLNVAQTLLQRNLEAGRGRAVAVIDVNGQYTYADIDQQSLRFANLLIQAGIKPEQRVLLALEDTVAFHICFLGAIRAGVVAVPLNTLLTADDYSFIADDSRAVALVASHNLIERMPQGTFSVRIKTDGAIGEFSDLNAELERSTTDPVSYRSRADDIAFWLYTSGTTGKPKGVMHSHADMLATANTYAAQVLSLTPEDVVFSAAKLFFAYGLGNALTFPMAAGASVVLLQGAPLPESVDQIIQQHKPTVFFGVPTLYAMLLNTQSAPGRETTLRLCLSAGEALPSTIFDRWLETTGVEILDGIGSTEMLHIYISNRSGTVSPGTSGQPVSGYEVKLLDENGSPCGQGEMGDLHVRGPSMSPGYWNRRALNQATFLGDWMRTGDKYLQTSEGTYQYCGRSDDLLKVGGIYVSPMEVENALLAHKAVAEAAVVGAEDADQLTKPKAYVVLAPGREQADQESLERELIDHVASKLAAYKRPRWVVFASELPKTATGKIQRFKLR
jgi:benzoate-CoA ligase